MANIGEPIKRHEVIPIENEPIPTPEPQVAPAEPVKEPEKAPV